MLFKEYLFNVTREIIFSIVSKKLLVSAPKHGGIFTEFFLDGQNYLFSSRGKGERKSMHAGEKLTIVVEDK